MSSRVLILCAIPVEIRALKALLKGAREDPFGQSYCVTGVLELNGRTFDTYLVEVGVGSVEAALNTEAAVSQLRPDLVVFAGIAGGVKDVNLGDVVIASRVHYYEGGKETEDGLRARPRALDVPFRVEQIAKSIARSHTHDYAVFVAPVAAGEKVVASGSAQTTKRLREHYSDALAVEMEGAGFIEAMRRFRDRDFALVRAISDLLENKHGTDAEGWQETASAHARDVTLQLVERYFETQEPGDLEVQGTSDGTPLVAESVAVAIPRPDPSQVYVLIAPKGSSHAVELLRSGLPIACVLDLDADTDVNGLLSECQADLETRRLIHLATPLEIPAMSRASTTWIAVNGLNGRSDPVDYRTWSRNRRREVRSGITELARMTGGRSVTVLAPNADAAQQWARALIEDLVTELGDSCRVVSLGEPHATSRDVGQDHHLAMEAGALAAGLERLVVKPEVDSNFRIPLAPDSTTTIEPQDLAWLHEDLTILGLNEGQRGNPEVARLEFLRGAEVSWTALEHDADVWRDLYPEFKKVVQGVLRNRRTYRENLFHEPGAGGSTIARRLLFDLHSEFPAVVIHAIRPGETARRIDWIARKSELPVLCVVDTTDLSDRSVGDLFSEIQAASTAAVMCHVSRRFQAPSELSRSPFLHSRLSDIEAEEFFDRYSHAAPLAYSDLVAVRDMADERRNAFFFGLTAFEEDFHGLEDYVSKRLDNVPEDQRRLALFCALAHYYGQQSLPEHLLAEMVGLPASRSAKLVSVLTPSLRSLLHRTVEGRWRTVHQLVAKQLVIQLGAPRWQDQLTTWGAAFADFCRETGGVGQEALDILRAVLFERGTQELLGTEVGGRDLFARLIEDVPSREGAVNLLSRAASLYPDEPHLAAHVARYYAFRLRNFERAAEYADKAARLAPNSATLFHVLGMVHRARTYDAIGRRASLDEVKDSARQSAGAFERSRELASIGNEYAYVSDAQLRIRLIDYAVRDSGSIASYIRGTPDPYIIECLNVAENLLYALRGQGDPRNPTRYEQQARASLTALYGDFELALQMFDALLTRPGTDRVPVRRQIVWTHLARQNREWRALKPKSLKRIVALLEENFQERAYDGADVRQWWRVIRYVPEPPAQDRVHEVLTYWREQERTVEALYTSYVAYAIDVLDGISTALPHLEKYVNECSLLARGFARRSQSFDWIGSGRGVAQLVHQSELGGWDKTSEFWKDTGRLRRVTGRVKEIRGPQAGHVDLNGLSAFFVPQRAGLERGRHENVRVSGFLGFSYDGPRLWEVKRES